MQNMASNAKNERAMKVKTVFSDGRQLNTYFPLHCKLVLAQVSVFKSYVVIPSEPGDKRKDDQSLFINIKCYLRFRFQSLAACEKKGIIHATLHN